MNNKEICINLFCLNFSEHGTHLNRASHE